MSVTADPLALLETAAPVATDLSQLLLNRDYQGVHFIADFSPSRLTPSSIKQAVFIRNGEGVASVVRVKTSNSINLKGGTSYSAKKCKHCVRGITLVNQLRSFRHTT